jgi:hypothetical protein
MLLARAARVGRPCCFRLEVVAVLTRRPRPVRCGKSRPVVLHERRVGALCGSLFGGMMPAGGSAYPGLSFQRSPVCACSLVLSLLLNRATMSQESSLTQSAHSVRQVLTAYIETMRSYLLIK